MAPLPGKVLLHCEYISRSCVCHIEYEIAEEAMNFSYVAEFSREWGEPNARDMGRMTSQPKAKGEMYILNDGMDMNSKDCSYGKEIGRARKEPDARSASHLSDTIASYALCHLSETSKVLLETTATQYQQPAQAPQQALNLEQAMMNLNKVMEDFVEPQKSINAQLSQKISLPDRVESSLNKKMDGVQHDLSQKIDNIQHSISRFSNLNTMQEKENSPSQPHQNQKGIHEMEAKGGEIKRLICPHAN
ncbi:hypothetical protein CK203_093889 [Vitis vinifera]|uniref:Uncharacterized protein n=1 Tax=Vitis vinifera TaxID=29760 RepID=A0A438C7L0_VITVI|nr:hypothetical protein CK203_093889 [Vitis vinifera]